MLNGFSFRSAFVFSIHHSAFIIQRRCQMLIPFVPQKFRKRPPKPKLPVAAPVVGPVLVQAIYPVEDVVGAIDLVFDRAISIEGLDGTQIIVKDGLISGMINNVAFGELRDPQTVRLFLQGLEDYSLPNQLLDATGDNGIASVDTGDAWAGVSELGLPWP
jgi:hypothetical protein